MPLQVGPAGHHVSSGFREPGAPDCEANRSSFAQGAEPPLTRVTRNDAAPSTFATRLRKGLRPTAGRRVQAAAVHGGPRPQMSKL